MLFGKKEIKKEKFYLRIYANLGKSSYSEIEKEALILHFQSMTKELFGMFKLKYDIHGSGYGFSKGSPSVGEKAFRNRFLKVGYAKSHGIWVVDWDAKFMVDLTFSTWDYLPQIPHLRCFFSFPLGSVPEFETSMAILKSLSKVMNLSYGYGFYAPYKMSDIMETYHERVWFKKPIQPFPFKIRLRWEKKLEICEQGGIRRLCEYNVLNKIQRQTLNDVRPDQEYPINNEVSLWIINLERLDELNQQWREFIFDEQSDE